jgi:hypothetical protein
MEKLSLYLIRDLINIVNFYLTLRTIDFKNDTEILKIITEVGKSQSENILKLSYKYKTTYDMFSLVGITDKDNFFYIAYYGELKYRMFAEKNLNGIIDNYLDESDLNKFYEFQNATFK